MTEIFINGSLVDFEEAETITASYGNLSFGDFSSRRGVKTNNYKLPMTNTNKLILGSVQNPSDGSLVAYRFQEIRVLIDGLEVFYGLANVNKSQEYYELICISGMSNFYASIKDKLLTDLDLSEYDHVYNQISIEAGFTRTVGYNYAYCSYGQWNAQLFTTGIPPEVMKPQVFFHTVVRQIFIDAGYTLVGNVLDNVRLKAHMILYNKFPSKLVYGADDPFSLASTLPDKVKQSAVILDFLNIYGVMLDVNEYDKIVTATFIDDIIYNEPIDWSSKIDDSEKPSLEYAFDDYGQYNTIAFKTDDKYPGDLGTVVEIDDLSLPRTGEIYTSPFYCFMDDQPDLVDTFFKDSTRTFELRDSKSRMRNMWSGGFFYEIDDIVYYNGTYYRCIQFVSSVDSWIPTNTDYWKPVTEKDVWNYTVRPMYGTLSVNPFTFPPINFPSSDPAPLKIITGANMDWAYSIANHYEVFRRVIDKTKIVEHLFKLSYTDINQLDLTRPIWLDRYNNLFIIDEIIQFHLNQVDSTAVRLIRL